MSDGLAGHQRPRISHVPPYVSSSGQEAVELVETAGLFLDPWEAFVLGESLNENKRGEWSAFEVGLMVSRQNGKDEILTARQLAGLFLLGERLIISSAHQFDTSLESFRRLLAFVENTPEFSRRVKRISRSHGEEGIELTNGQRIRFRTRTKGGGRGFTCDLLMLNEAMDINTASIGALLPTLSARPNPQVIYAGSAVDQWIHDNGVVFARVRERGHKGDDPSLAYFEWSADCDNPEKIGDLARDPAIWAEANPGFGIRISAEHIDHEQHSMDARTFAVERLGVGDWPEADGSSAVVSMETWGGCGDIHSKLEAPPCFAFDVTPDRSFAAIGVAGLRADGDRHIEVVAHRRGTNWVVERMAELVEKHGQDAVICDGASPAASLLTQMKNRGIDVTVVSAKEYAQACGGFFDACEQQTLHHLETPELTAAVKGAVKRTLGDTWAWSRKSSGVDISPLVACTLAAWGVSENEAAGQPWVLAG
jgi:hypothetical protein